MSSPHSDRADDAAGASSFAPARGWEAELTIGFVKVGEATILRRGHQRGPLAVQRPFSPEGPEVSHVTLLHPPGGLVGGDRLRVSVDVGPGAQAVITTPAAAKHYRSAGLTACQEQRFTVGAGAALEWLPHETILFDGAISQLRTRVQLDAGACFIGIDLVCFGLPARAERFQRGRCRQRLELWRRAGAGPRPGEGDGDDGDLRPLVLERGDFDGGAPVHDARWGLAGAPVLGTLLAAPAPPGDCDALAAIRALARALPPGDLASVTRLGICVGVGLDAPASALCCRYLGGSAERGGHFLREAWRLLRPVLLGRVAVKPRIWAT